jgi:enhancing lycopene biosynthesis protein 2
VVLLHSPLHFINFVKTLSITEMKKFAVILSGCGVYDGSEIHEAVMALLAISKAGATYQVFAPDINQYHVVNHLKGEPANETRNVLVESARIARGQIKALNEFNASDFDALVLPGGFGAAKNLSTYAFEGAAMKVNDEVAKALRAMHEMKKPIGAMCIAPVILAKVFGHVDVTIGQDAATIKNIESFGAAHHKTTHGEVTVDEKNRIVTTPCYMLDANIADIAQGAENMVRAILKLM